MFGWLFLIGFLIIFYNYYWKRRGLPPGPPPLPIFGNIGEIQKHPPGYDAYKKWRNKYGPVFTYWIGEKPLVAIADYETMKETIIDDGDNGAAGITSFEGEEWVEQRKFAIKTFHRLGMGKNIMQEKMFIELTRMFEDIDEEIKVSNNNDIDITPFVETCIASIIYSILFDYQITKDRKDDFLKMKNVVYEYTGLFGHWAVQMIMGKPYIFKDLPYFKEYFKKIQNVYFKMANYVEKMAENATKNYKNDMDNDANDYVTAFLRQQDATGGEKGFFNLANLNSTLVDFYIAGQDTTINTINWGIIYLMYEPEVIKKMQKEMDTVLGDREVIGINDKVKLPYTAAVVNEIQRMANIMPQNLARRTTKDVVIRGYQIPKGTTIMPIHSAVLYDERIFPNHLQFDPNRFLDDNGNLKRVDEFIPFPIGKRLCLGAEMARMELFLILSNLYFNYDISMPSSGVKPSLQKSFGLTIKPDEFKCFVQRRK